ncbi:MAG: ribosome assembly RNA-binding protein YhbY [Betaproteobacteria bacterium]|nr:MAG: ribosome assembly RNA-binding protein YhbY [Betaproteobacteria bacterium]
MKTLTPQQRKFLRAEAHDIKPVVMIGNNGLTEAVIAETNRALTAHELIKVRVQGDDRAARELWLTELCAATDAAPVQHIGKLLIIYKPAATPRLQLP